MCYTLDTAERCTQAFGTLNEFAVSDLFRGIGNRYGDADEGAP